MNRIILLTYSFLLFFSLSLNAKDPIFLAGDTIMVDSIMKSMPLEEKIGQLIMVASINGNNENGNGKNIEKVIKAIEENKVGGVLFLKSEPVKLASLVNLYKSKTRIPLFFAIDGENGLSFRLDSTIKYPYPIGIGAISDDSIIYYMGKEIGRQCKALGINVNFAPVGDVNSNPENPIINYRSFGQDPLNVANKCLLLAKGMQDEKMIVSLKHFPGHGDTSFDSHLTLPVINKNYSQLDSVEFIPFKTCINNGINGIMSAHIYMSGIDNERKPATLSKKIMTGILKDSLGFQGLIFSDGMNMKGISSLYSEGQAAVEALRAGVDVIEFVLNPENVIYAVKDAIGKGRISEKEINEKCRKVLLAKSWSGAFDSRQVDLNEIRKELNRPEYNLTSRLITEKTLTVLKNKDSVLPLKNIDTLKIAALSIGEDTINFFQEGLARYANVDNFCLGKDTIEASKKNLSFLKNYNLVIVSVHGTRMLPSNQYGISKFIIRTIEKVCSENKTIVSFFGNPYALNYLKGLEKSYGLILTYGDNQIMQDLASQLIFGSIKASGRLPVTINEEFKSGSGIDTEFINRLKYTIPEEEGICSDILKKRIDSLVMLGLSEKAYPGCQVLVAKNSKIIFHECYGNHTFDDSIHVKKGDLYDWASITKITGPLPLIMKFYENSILKLDVPFSNYWEDFKNSNKSDFTPREALTHQARLIPWIPFYAEPLEQTRKNKKYFSDTPSEKYSVRVSSNLYMLTDYKKIIYKKIKESKLLSAKSYSYSDLCFIIFPEVISNITGISYEDFLNREFLKPLGVKSVCYNPYRFYPKNMFIPTENDEIFRKELLCGFVHDETAAVLGGVSGNAGLFGTTQDLAIIMQFYLNGGNYGGFKYLSEKTINEFTRIQYPENQNRRGLGFDKPYLDNKRRQIANAYPAVSASKSSFGHTGFTGTFAWADPENQLIVVIMTNRVNPTRENDKLMKMNLRPMIHQVVYDCMNTFKIFK